MAESPHSLCVNALTARLGVTQSAVSQHLRILRQAGLVTGERRGNHVHYSLDRRQIAGFAALFMEPLGKHLPLDGESTARKTPPVTLKHFS